MAGVCLISSRENRLLVFDDSQENLCSPPSQPPFTNELLLFRKLHVDKNHFHHGEPSASPDNQPINQPRCIGRLSGSLKTIPYTQPLSNQQVARHRMKQQGPRPAPMIRYEWWVVVPLRMGKMSWWRSWLRKLVGSSWLIVVSNG